MTKTHTSHFRACMAFIRDCMPSKFALLTVASILAVYSGSNGSGRGAVSGLVQQPHCGNAICEAGEGGLRGTCLVDCKEFKGTCGNGIREAREECDDGNKKNGDGCSVICKVERRK